MSIAHAPLGQSSDLPFDFVTPVWGKAYTNLFLDIALPTYLSDGNLPAAARASDSVYRIYTTDAEAEQIRCSAAFAALARLMPAEVITITDRIADKYLRMSYCHKMAIERADERGAAIVFLAPDAVASDGSLSALSRLANSGKRVVFVVGVRLHLEQVAPLLKARSGGENGTITVSSRELMEMSLAHLHPITIKHIWNGGTEEMIANNLFWQVPGEGLLARCFHALPIMVYPRVKKAPFISTIDDDYVQAACPDPDDWYIVADSDEMLICELSTIASDIPGGPKSIPELVKFAELYASATHRVTAQTRIFMHTGKRTPEKWAAVERDSDAVIDEVLAALQTKSSRLLASNPALLLRRLRRRAHEASLATRTGRKTSDVVPGRIERFAVATLGRLFEAAYAQYPRLVSRYLPIREKVLGAVFGIPPAPYPWSWLWLEYRGLERTFSGRTGNEGIRDRLFVAPSRDETALTPPPGIVCFALPQGADFEWPFETGRFSSVLILLRHAQADQVGHVFREATRVLRDGGTLAVDGLPGSWRREEILGLLPTGYKIDAINSYGGRFSRTCLRARQAVQSLTRRVPARICWEILLSPVLLTIGPLAAGLANALAVALDHFDSRRQGGIGKTLLARKGESGDR